MNVIKKDSEFYSLVATKKYSPGDLIFVLSGSIISSPTRTSIEICQGKHIEDEYGKYMNHSFEPTTKINTTKVIATKTIEVGEELTFDYTTNETKMACPFIDNKTNKFVCGKITQTN